MFNVPQPFFAHIFSRPAPRQANKSPTLCRGALASCQLLSTVLIMLCLVCPVVVGLRCIPWCAGAVACQVFDAIYPGDVSMSKVKWDAKSDHEFIQNYKILQRTFESVRQAWHRQVH